METEEPMGEHWQVSVNRERRIEYAGYYRVGEKQYPGRIIVLHKPERTEFLVFVKDPPVALKRHPKGGCFRHQKDGWYKIHWERFPDSAIAAVVYVENLFSAL